MYEVTDQQIDQWFADRPGNGMDATDPRQRETVITELRNDHLFDTTDVPPCPSWCVMTDHPYDSVESDGETLWRCHTTSESGDGAIDQEERNRAGVVMLSPPSIAIWIDGDRRDAPITSERAREYAAKLLELADLLDEITS